MSIKEILVDGVPAKICTSETLVMTPVVPVAYRAAADLMEQGYAFNDPFIDRKHSVIWVEIDSKVVSYIIYELKDLEFKNLAYIVMSWVDTEHRRKGLRTIIDQYFVEELKSHGIIYIETQTHLSNDPIDSAYEKLGYKKYFYKRYKKI